jgi:hypothetical protein
MQRRKFSGEFKIEAVRLVRDRGVSVAQACTPPAAKTAALSPIFTLQANFPRPLASSRGTFGP